MAPDPNSPIRHFRADSPFSKSESAGVVQMYDRLHNFTKQMRAFRLKSCASRPKKSFGKSQQAILCAKQIFFAQTGHTRRRAELCGAALQADSLGTCCERQKRHRVMKPVLYKMTSICLSIVWPMHLWAWNKPPEIAYTFGHLLMITL